MNATTTIKYCVICKINSTECQSSNHFKKWIDAEISLEEYENNIKNNVWPNLIKDLKIAKINVNRLNELRKFSWIGLNSFEHPDILKLPRPNSLSLYFMSFLFFITLITIITPLFWNSLPWIIGCMIESDTYTSFEGNYIDWITDFYKIDLNYFYNKGLPSRSENNLLTQMFLARETTDKNFAWFIMIIGNFIPSFIIVMFKHMFENDKRIKTITQKTNQIYLANIEKSNEKYNDLIEEEIKSIQL